MAAINEEVLSSEVSKGRFAPVYLLYGDDPFLKKYYADKISDKNYDGDPFFNLNHFTGDNELQEVYDAVTQMPMMSDKKCVTLTDFDYEHASAQELEMLCSLIGEIDEGCTFVMRFDSIEVDDKKSAKAKKLFSAVEKAGGKVVRLDHRKPAQLAKMLTDGATKRGCKMDSSVARYMIESVGDDISTLKNELEKVCNFVGSGVIDRATVDNVCTKSVEASVFDYIKEVLAGNLEGALKLLDGLFYTRVEPMIILHTASSSFVDIYRAYAANKAGVPIAEVAKEFGYKNRAFLLDRAAASLRNFDRKKISLCFDVLLSTDKALKSFRLDERNVLEQMTVRLVYIILKGDSVDKA